MSKLKAIRLFWIKGPASGMHFAVAENQSYMIGRDASVDIPLSFDDRVSRRHCRIFHDGSNGKLEDCKSTNGTYLNKARIAEEQALKEGDLIGIGSSTLRVRENANLTRFETVCEILRCGDGQLYAVVDAARHADIVPMLANSGEMCQSLFEGPKGAELTEVAPYLVQLTETNPLLQSLVYSGWGQSWAIYLRSAKPFADIRNQLRRSLMVKAEGAPPDQRLYFRFYDPRVLRVWLPECTPDQLKEFLGPIDTIAMEDDSAEKVLRFSMIREKFQSVPIATDPATRPFAPRPPSAGVTVAWSDQTQAIRGL